MQAERENWKHTKEASKTALAAWLNQKRCLQGISFMLFLAPYGQIPAALSAEICQDQLSRIHALV